MLALKRNILCRIWRSPSTNQLCCISFSIPSSLSSSSGESSSQVPAPRRSGVQSWQRKGAGGRNSFSGVVATIFGANGYNGRYVAGRLGKEGCQLIIPYRCDPYWVRHLKLAGDLGQTLFFPFDLLDDDSIRKVVKYSNVVINMIGRDHETPNWSFYDVHEHGARRLARISREMGVEKFIHVSAMNASHNPPETLIPGGSHFLRSKAAGEDAVREEFPGAIIVRPSEMYGYYDNYLYYFSYWFRVYNRWKMELWKKGEETFKMPLYGPDLAAGIHKCIHDPTLAGQTLEFVGPYCYSVADIVDWIIRKIGEGDLDWKYARKDGYSPFLHWRINLAEWKSWITKRPPRMSWEMVERYETVSDELTGAPTLQDIGVKNLRIFEYASRPILERYYTRAGYQENQYQDIVEPPEPRRLPPVYKNKPRPKYQTTSRTFETQNTGFAGL